MMNLLSCRYNMDINRVEARFEDGTTLAIDCIAIEDEYGNTPAQAGHTPRGYGTAASPVLPVVPGCCRIHPQWRCSRWQG